MSTAGQIEVPRWNRLNDCTFEKLLLLKANSFFAEQVNLEQNVTMVNELYMYDVALYLK